MSLYVVDGYWVNGYTVAEEAYGRVWWLRQRPKEPPRKRKVAAIEMPEPEEIPPNPQEIPAVLSFLGEAVSPYSSEPPRQPSVSTALIR